MALEVERIAVADYDPQKHKGMILFGPIVIKSVSKTEPRDGRETFVLTKTNGDRLRTYGTETIRILSEEEVV